MLKVYLFILLYEKIKFGYGIDCTTHDITFFVLNIKLLYLM
jgi:hypothetical protein